jgi:hypothetical protein
MILRIGFDKKADLYFIQINKYDTNNISMVYVPNINGIINFINVVKFYDKISIVFDTSLTVEQREDIKVKIKAFVSLP